MILAIESLLVLLVLTTSLFFSLVSMVGVGKRAVALHAVTLGEDRRKGRCWREVVQDWDSDGIETIVCSSDGIGTLVSNSDGIEAADGSGKGIGLNNGRISWIFLVTELVIFEKSDS